MRPGESLSEREARQVLLGTQIFFFATVLLCLLIVHGEIVENDGISYFGIDHRTVEVLVLSFTVAAYGLWRTSTYFQKVQAPVLLVTGLRAIAVSLFVLLITPFNKGTFLNWTHMITGVAMALVELAIAVQLSVDHRSTASVAALSIGLAGGILAALSLPNWNFPHLLQGEIIYELGFSWCLFQWLRVAAAERERTLFKQSQR